LRELARDLCLDVGSFVFVDDSPLECAEVHAALGGKGVAVVRLPREPDALPAFLRECWAFDAPPARHAPTREDESRTKLYRELAARRQVQTAAASSSAFFASLNLCVAVAPLEAEAMPRAAPLTERTNQHNACKRQASAADLAALAANPSVRCWSVDASDRFGDHGTIGLVVADEGATVAPAECGDGAASVLHVRCWLLSCRSLHLGIEHQMLQHVGRAAADAGATEIAIHWRRAERNEPAAAFLFSLPGV